MIVRPAAGDRSNSGSFCGSEPFVTRLKRNVTAGHHVVLTFTQSGRPATFHQTDIFSPHRHHDQGIVGQGHGYYLVLLAADSFDATLHLASIVRYEYSLADPQPVLAQCLKTRSDDVMPGKRPPGAAVVEFDRIPVSRRSLPRSRRLYRRNHSGRVKSIRGRRAHSRADDRPLTRPPAAKHFVQKSPKIFATPETTVSCFVSRSCLCCCSGSGSKTGPVGGAEFMLISGVCRLLLDDKNVIDCWLAVGRCPMDVNSRPWMVTCSGAGKLLSRFRLSPKMDHHERSSRILWWQDSRSHL